MLNVNDKINRELLSKQTEIALKISSYAHFMCLGLFLILKYILHFEGPIPYFLLVYFIVSFLNTFLFRKHRRIVIVSLIFFSSSFITTLLIAAYSGGLTSPFLGVIIVATMGSFISSLKHGRSFLVLSVIGFLLLFLNDIYAWIPDQGHSQVQQRYFALLTYAFIFIISGAAGLTIAKTSFRGYQAKKEVEKQKLIIEASKEEIELQKEKSDNLLLNILPATVAEELRSTGISKPRLYENVSIGFTDFSGFTGISEKLSPEQLIEKLDKIFLEFDKIIEKYELQRIKTIGDAYMFAAGLPDPIDDHAKRSVEAAIEMRDYILQFNADLPAHEPQWNIRIGVNSGPVVAGVIGIKKFAYDIWGDSVNTAARMEESGEIGKVNISCNTYKLVKEVFTSVYRGRVYAKNKGYIEMYFVEYR